MSKIIKLNIRHVAKFQAVIMACIGLVLGLAYAFIGLAIDLYNLGAVNIGSALAFLAIVGMPIVLALCGCLVGVIATLIYNSISPCFGGIDFGQLSKKTRSI